VLSGIVFFDERLTWPMLAGGAATIIGVAIIVIRRPRMVAPATKSGL
jgi:O-acetylserine/cysteine efflux transporter